jgi:homogentisate 1,2-dioxygenase
MKRYIQYPRVAGTASRQAHADLPAGTFEREMSKEGFFGPAAFFYHRHPPTGWTSFEGPLRPHAFDLAKLATAMQSPWDAAPILENAHCRLRWLKLTESMDHLARNGDGDELLFIHAGAAELFCDFGHLSIRAGDYVVLPRGTLWRLELAAPLSALLIEATNASYGLPDKGLVGPHAIFDPAMLDVPALDAEFIAQQEQAPPRSSAGARDWPVRIKRRQAISTARFPFNPLDAVGWHGDLAVCRINVRDLRPLMSHRYHLPPSAHTTFLAHRFVVCTFVPRPFETDPGAIKVPFFHNNDDYDEVIFYHAGDFFSRDNIHPGMLSFHPSGFTHGPHPKALSRMLVQTKPGADEYAVMIDARDPLELGAAAAGVEWPGYVDSWKSGQ